MTARMADDRHTLDRVAHAVVTGKRGLGKELDRLADDVAGLMLNRLAAARAPGLWRVAHLRWHALTRWQRTLARYDASFLRIILAKVEKHLAGWLREEAS